MVMVWSPDGTAAGVPVRLEDVGGRLWPVAKFRRRFERPDLVQKALVR